MFDGRNLFCANIENQKSSLASLKPAQRIPALDSFVKLEMSGWFEVLRVGFVVAILIVMGWQCLKLRRTPLATTYWVGAGVYAWAHTRFFPRRRNRTDTEPDLEGGGGAALPALVGAGPRGPRSAADAKAWPEV